MVKIQKQWNVLNKSIKGNIIETILKGRGIKDTSHFLNPRSEDMIDFELLSNIRAARNTVLDGIKYGKRFTVLWDSDLDGNAGGAITTLHLLNYTNQVNPIINQGKIHGLSGQNGEDLIATTDILIAVDSLSNEHEHYKTLSDNGVKIICLDHHPSSLESQKYATVVNSQLNDYPNKMLSGSGVALKFALYIDQYTGEEFAEDLYDLAACGLIADMMDIKDSWENRYICWRGMNSLKNIGIQEILNNYRFDGQAISYSIAPAINACNRTSNNELAMKLLLTQDKREVKSLVKQIKEIKKQQDALVDENVNDVEFQIRNNLTEQSRVISGFVNDGGFSGLIANKLASKYQMPCIILHENEEETEVYKGSMRSYGLENFRDVLNQTKLCKALGHEGAAGVIIPKENWSKLIQKINEVLADVEFKVTVEADIELNVKDIAFDLVQKIQQLNLITGTGFKNIQVILKNCPVDKLTLMQSKHTKFENGSVEIIHWNNPRLFEELQCDTKGTYKTIDVCGSLSISEFAGKEKINLIVSEYGNITEELDFLRE